ncbi:hypothetical protein HDU96_010397 [Phlyctochytrium bullatum]|nr:hypothetical protein HDU96_010397 [Phlyctochytrium bullatum]
MQSAKLTTVSFVSRYIRDASQDAVLRQEILDSLESNKPHIKTVTAAVILIDISGFSSLTEELAKRGKISSELITRTVSDYLSDIIKIVWQCGGDVIKFLGDALLVCMEARRPDEPAHLLAYRAVECAAKVMKLHSSKTIEFPSTTRCSPSVTSRPTSFYAEASAAGPSTPADTLGRDLERSVTQKGAHIVTLRLHTSVAAGHVQKVIVGTLKKAQRCDFAISGQALVDVGKVLEPTLPGEIGLSATILKLIDFNGSVASKMKSKSYRFFAYRGGETDGEESGAVFLGDCMDELHLISAQAVRQATLGPDNGGSVSCLPVSVDSLTSPAARGSMTVGLNPAARGSMTIARDSTYSGGGGKRPSAYGSVDGSGSIDTESDTFCKMFVNESIVWKLERIGEAGHVPKTTNSRRGSFQVIERRFGGSSGGSSSGSGVSEVGRLALIKRRSVTADVIGGFMSALPSNKRRASMSFPDREPDDVPLGFVDPHLSYAFAEYRLLSIMFIKLNFPYDAETAQVVFELTVDTLQECDGCFQQYSVDDKGQSIMAVFGLPPRSHENNTLFALKAATALARGFRERGISPVTIALTTDEILYSVLGNQLRSEASFLGDVVNLSARIMCIQPPRMTRVEEEVAGEGVSEHRRCSTSSSARRTSTCSAPPQKHDVFVFCDTKTKDAGGNGFRSSLFGEYRFKGMRDLVKVWRIGEGTLHKQREERKNSVEANERDLILVGYLDERTQLQTCFQKWYDGGLRCVSVIEGLSGMGKTAISQELFKFAASKPDVCIFESEASEVDKNATYFAFQGLVPRLIEALERLPIEKLDPTTNFDVQSINEPETPASPTSPATNQVNESPQWSRTSVTSLVGRKSTRRVNMQSSPALSTRASTVKRGPTQKGQSARPSLPPEPPEPLGLIDTAAAINLAVAAFSAGAAPKKRFYRNHRASVASRGSFVSSPDRIPRIAKVMVSLNESLDLIPLLNDVMPGLNAPESTRTAALTAESKTELLKSLVVKIIRSASEFLRILLIVDNAQWLDSLSQELLLAIVKSCPKVFTAISTRPLDEYRLGNTIGKLCPLPYCLHFVLRGFSCMDTQRFLLKRFEDKGVKAISTTLLNEIFKRCGGCPLITEQACDTLRAAFGERLFVSSSGVLETNYDLVDYDKLLLRSGGGDGAISSMFYRLSPSFQLLLRVASVFGQHFDLAEVARVMDGDHTLEELIESVNTSDTYSYLKQLKKEEEGGNRYMFRHVMIQSAIYKSLPYTVRENYHTRIVQLKEQILHESNKKFVLPVLCYHALRAPDISRRIKYLDEVSVVYISQSLLQEACLSLKTLIAICESDEKLIEEKAELSRWWSLLAESQVKSRQYRVGRESALRALFYAGIAWPTDREGFDAKRAEEDKKLARLWISTWGARLPVASAGRDAIWDEIMITVMRAFREIVAFDCSITKEEHGLIATTYLNATIAFAASGGCDALANACTWKAQYHLNLSSAGVISDHLATRMILGHVVSSLICSGQLIEASKEFKRVIKQATMAEDVASQVILLASYLPIPTYLLDKDEASKQVQGLNSLLDTFEFFKNILPLSAISFHVASRDFDKVVELLENLCSTEIVASQVILIQMLSHLTFYLIVVWTEWSDCPDKPKLAALIANVRQTLLRSHLQKLAPAFQAQVLSSAACSIAAGDAEAAVTVLRKAFRWRAHDRRGGGITSDGISSPRNDNMLCKALVAAAIARFSAKAAEKQDFIVIAERLLDKCGVKGVQRWMAGGPFSF